MPTSSTKSIPIVSLVASLAVLSCQKGTDYDVPIARHNREIAPQVAATPPPPVAVAAVAPLAVAVVAPAAAHVTKNKDALTVTRSRCEAAGCELVFQFSHAMVKRSKMAGAKRARIVFDPPQAGRWKWRSPKELVFTPKKGALHWGHKIEIDLDKAQPLAGSKYALAAPWSDPLRVPNFSIAGKWSNWPVIPGQPRFVAILDQYNREIGHGPVFMAFDQPVSPARIARYIRATVHGESVKVAVWRPKTIARVWSEKETDTSPIVAVRVAGLPANGTTLTLRYPKEIGKVAKDTTFGSRKYTVRTSLAIKSVELQGNATADRVPLRARWRIELTGPISSKQAQNSITLSPKPKNSYVYTYGTTAFVYATLKPGKRYRLRVAAGMRDTIGNVLKRGTRQTFVAQDLKPALELPKNVLVLESARSRIPLRITNLTDVRVRSHHISDITDYIRRLASGSDKCAIPDTVRSTSVATKKARNKRVTLDAAFKISQRGLTCVAISARGVGSEKDNKRIEGSMLTQVTNIGITAKVHRKGVIAWVTRLSDAAPVTDATVSFLGADGSLISKARTDKDGIARLDGKSVTSRGTVEHSFIVAETTSDVALTQISDNRISQPWQFGLNGDVKSSEPLTASVFTDRGVYRPKETVHFNVIARQIGKDGALGMPIDKVLKVTVSDPRGATVVNKELDLDEYGTADASLELKENAAVGRYTIRIAQGDRVAVRSFRVEEYRVPTFEVAVKSDQPSWSLRKRVHISIAADYLHGGKLASRRVAYTVSRVPAPMRPSRFPGFTFGQQHLVPPKGQLVAAEGKLDGQGMLSFDFAPSHPVAAGPMRYVIDAHVTDVDRQAYAGRLARVVHPSDIYLGVRLPKRRVVSSGDAIKVPVVAITPEGVAKPGVKVVVTAEAIDYHTTARIGANGVERRNRAVTRRVTKCTVKTAATAKSCTLRLRRAGYYRITARAVDGKKRKIASGFEITVGGAQKIAWPRFDHERIEILTDKSSYRAGDVAKLAIQSPFATARGILTIERGDVIEHRTFEINNNTPIIDIPIKGIHAPNVYASVVLLRGRVHGRSDATGFDTGAPAFRVGYTMLNVEPESARLAVKVILDRKIAAPGGKLAIELDVRDASGAAITGQATVMVVDEAVLGLTRFKTPDPIAELYRPRALGVRTASSRLDLPHSRRARREPIFPGGGGGDWDDEDGESNADLGELGDMRNLFESTAYWNPRVAIKHGRAKLEIELPDNVTTFRVMAVVVDRGARAGASDAKVVVRKPVMVKPVLPRFAHPGDEIIVQARVFNGGNEPGMATISAHFIGMRRADSKTQSKMVKPGSSATFSFPIKVTGSNKAVVRFAATIGRNKDAVQVEIPILDPGTRRKVIETRTISDSGTIDLKLPKDRIPGTTSIEILASSTSLSKLAGAVEYVMRYPNGCIEQTTSTAYPLIVLEDLLPDMGITIDKKKLKEFATAGVKRLLSFQTTSGGLAYWPGSNDPHAFGTAFGLTALIEAKARGYDVPDKALAEMAAYLSKSLKSGKITESMPHGGMADGDTRALFVMTLGRLGHSRDADIALLWQERDKLTGFGLSFLAVAVDEGHGDSALLEPILEEIRKRAVVTKDEAFFKGSRDHGWSMGSPLRTHAAALLAYAGSKRGGSMSPKLLKGLLERQTHGMWGNTQENVFGIMAVAKAVQRRGSTGSMPELSIALNGSKLAKTELRKLSKNTLQYKSKLAGRSAKVFVKNGGGTPTIVTVRADYDEPLTKATMKPVNNGFAVERQYETLAGKSLEGSTIPLGDVIAVRIRVTTTTAQNYVAIADRLPAGLEPLNTSLATTQKVAGRVASKAEARGLGVLSYSETRDSRVAFYADSLPPGTYEFTYLARATNAGTFWRPAAQADAMYDPDVVGTSSIDKVVIK